MAWEGDDEIMIDELGTIAHNVMNNVIQPDYYYMPTEANKWS